MSELICHITRRAAWSTARKRGVYIPAETREQGGFIHCSMPRQVRRVANHLFRGQRGLVLLLIDPARLTSELRWEAGEGLSAERFPHIYGPLNLDAVVQVLDFQPGPAGAFDSPLPWDSDR